uniref:hypothetical protein n=1 Tax=Aquabacterium sp. TaxID=1872578 RepID=UPI0025BEBEB2
DVCVLAKLAPEDVIAVPEYDANKMRVCGYHIIMELSKDEYAQVRSNKPITDLASGKTKLAMAMNGQHIRKTHEVKIHGHMGADVKVTEIAEVPKYQKPEAKHTEVEALGNPEAETKDVPVDPKTVVKQIAGLSRKEQAKILYDNLATGGQEALDAIHAFKKAAKVSWEKLGLPEINGPVISIREPATITVAVTQKVEANEIVKPADKSQAKRLAIQVAGSEGSPRERIQKLLAIGLSSQTAKAIKEIKQKAKKSWDALGVDIADQNTIRSLTE